MLEGSSKTRFVDPSQSNQNGRLNQQYQANININSNQNENNLNPSNQANNSSYQNYMLSNGINNLNEHNANENSQIFDKIISEVINVNERGYVNTDMTNHQVQDVPFKFPGLEPPRQQLMLPEGVPAPLSVLAAQPPFTSDIRLINNIAQEAQSCINNFTLHVPDNVAFDFNPVA